jgi:hypothetical protein
LNTNDYEEKDSQGQIGTVGVWKTERLVANDTDNRSDEQHTSKAAKEITKTKIY